jgi:hypothetical protein
MAEMQNLASPPDSDWLDILSRLPPDLNLNQLARDTLAIQRARGMPTRRTCCAWGSPAVRAARPSSRRPRGLL